MKLDFDRLLGHRMFVVTSYVTLMMFVLPFLVYSVSRLTGTLPSADEWLTLGGSEGPWRWSPQGNLLWVSPVLIPTFTYLSAVVIAWRSRSLDTFKRGATVALVQFLILALPMYFLNWTIR